MRPGAPLGAPGLIYLKRGGTKRVPAAYRAFPGAAQCSAGCPVTGTSRWDWPRWMVWVTVRMKGMR